MTDLCRAGVALLLDALPLVARIEEVREFRLLAGSPASKNSADHAAHDAADRCAAFLLSARGLADSAALADDFQHGASPTGAGSQ